ncbi:MAG TPA: hypothetical protein VNW30_06870 [Opitutaceae bacterium]|nr:hypothetical protein [Opitutaceae bacterium]
MASVRLRDRAEIRPAAAAQSFASSAAAHLGRRPGKKTTRVAVQAAGCTNEHGSAAAGRFDTGATQR